MKLIVVAGHIASRADGDREGQIMAVLPRPGVCIWCRGPAGSNVSHVVPQALGNAVQVLHAGIVCARCNNFFGTGIEAALMNDPIVDMLRWYSGLRNVRTNRTPPSQRLGVAFPSTGHPTAELRYTMHIGSGGQVPAYALPGYIIAPSDNVVTLEMHSPRVERFPFTYDRRKLAKLSRAFYKIAVETLASLTYEIPESDFTIDLFSSDFNAVREWVRYGSPPTLVRPVLLAPFGTPSPDWEYALLESLGRPVVGMTLFGLEAVTYPCGPQRGSLPLLAEWAGREWLGDVVDAVWGIADGMFTLRRPVPAPGAPAPSDP